MDKEFDYSKADSQGTTVVPLAAADFDIEAYADYQGVLEERCADFMDADEGRMVYRRFRVPEVYSWGCRDMKMSLEWQLAALTQSMNYKADIPNFLEPWYGIGVVSSAYGIEYEWKEGQSPSVTSPYKTAREALEGLKGPVHESPVGRHVMDMISYFLEQTKGKINISLSDIQSPLNIASSYLLEPSAFMFEIFDHPEDLKALLDQMTELETEFLQKQIDLIGDALVKPGHGFASARSFRGLGFSDDNILMISNENYSEFAMPWLCRAAEVLDGPVFHSCGDWSNRAEYVNTIPGLLMADGAVGAQTDPSPNNPELLANAFAGSDAVLHVRIVGDAETILRNVGKMNHPGLRLIVTTYCETPAEQESAYKGIHGTA